MLPHFREAIHNVLDRNVKAEEFAGGRFAVKHSRGILMLIVLAAGLWPSFSKAQGLDPAALLKPATDTWPTYNGDYSGKRYSTLDQINAGNINSLTLAWAFQPHAGTIKSTPL